MDENGGVQWQLTAEPVAVLSDRIQHLVLRPKGLAFS
jgi:hypothetical protein